MGPFGLMDLWIQNSWYGDFSTFIDSSAPLFHRGGVYLDGILAGSFLSNRGVGGEDGSVGFRLVLAP